MDAVLADAKSLQAKANAADKRKLDEYLTTVRDIEVRIQRAEKLTAEMPKVPVPAGVPESYEEHMRLMFVLSSTFSTNYTSRERESGMRGKSSEGRR
jgi:hypothetical protein